MSAPPHIAPLPNKTNFTGKLVIMTCFYKSQAHARFTQSLVTTASVLERLGVKWDFWGQCGDFHVERACNGGMARFMEDKDATDLLMIDSDESWSVEAVLRMLAHKQHEVVGCAYRMKNNWEQYNCTPRMVNGVVDGYIGADGKAMMRADRLPGGFLRLKKSALQKFVDAYPNDFYFEDGKKVPAFFRTDIRDGKFFSGDFAFCDKLTAIGVQLWLDPNADISHYGDTEYAGNLEKWLRKADDKAAA